MTRPRRTAGLSSVEAAGALGWRFPLSCGGKGEGRDWRWRTGETPWGVWLKSKGGPNAMTTEGRGPLSGLAV